MAQIFHRSINLYSKASIVAVVLLGGAAFAGLFAFERSPYITYQGVTKPQPVPFSHQHHVAGLGIDCRYCHTSVETSNYASIPPTKTCINCHAIRGVTGADAHVAPDLTHVASRRQLGAGILENTPANMRRWLKNPQHIKPGALMPDFNFTDQQLDQLGAYLETLR